MCGRNIDRHIICRMLNRGKCINLFPHRKNNDTTRMLSCSTAHADTSKYNPVNFTVSLMYTALFIIIFDITECRLICQRTDGSRTERLTGAENNLCVFVCLTLVITGEVQVDIRLFVAVEAQEGLEGDIVAVHQHPGAAVGAVLVRQVKAVVHAAVGDLSLIHI